MDLVNEEWLLLESLLFEDSDKDSNLNKKQKGRLASAVAAGGGLGLLAGGELKARSTGPTSGSFTRQALRNYGSKRALGLGALGAAGATAAGRHYYKKKQKNNRKK